MASNIEQLRTLTQNLVESELIRSAFFDLSPDLFAVLRWKTGQKNNELKFSMVNQAWYEVLGYSVEEMTKDVYYDKIHPKDRTRAEDEAIPEYTAFELEQAIETAKKEGINYDPDRRVQLLSYTQRWLHKDGSIKYISWNGTFDFKNHVCYIVGRDITGSIEDFEAVRRFRHNLRNIAEDYLSDTIQMLTLSRDRLREIEKSLNKYEKPNGGKN